MAFFLAYIGIGETIVLAFLGLTATYMGLRQYGKYQTTKALAQVASALKK
jgi:hypothetical protein